MKRVYICEDHPLFRQSLEQLIANAEDLQLCGISDSGSKAIEELSELHPNVILLDLNLPEVDGFGVLDFVAEALPESKVIILTSYNDKFLADKARKAGAAAYVLKDTDGETLLQMIRETDSGKFVTNVVEQSEGSTFDKDLEFASILKLTRTEKKIVNGLIAGASVAQLAEQFFISENTVKNHKKNIYRKLQVSTQPELILLCQKHGLLD